MWGAIRRGATVIGLVVIAALIILAYRTVGGGGGDSSPGELVSSEAPDFTLPTLDGSEVKLADFRGEKNVLLYFNEGYG